MKNKRTDTHRPSAINPAEYEFIGCIYEGCSDDIAWEMADQNAGTYAAIRELCRTEGFTEGVNHSAGSCYCCGARAAYIGAFTHEPTKTVVRFGQVCAGKINIGDAGAFRYLRTLAADIRKRKAGKAKAALFLKDNGMELDFSVLEKNSVEQPVMGPPRMAPQPGGYYGDLFHPNGKAATPRTVGRRQRHGLRLPHSRQNDIQGEQGRRGATEYGRRVGKVRKLVNRATGLRQAPVGRDTGV